MFTGLVEGVGEIVGITAMAEGLRLAVQTSFPAYGTHPGGVGGGRRGLPDGGGPGAAPGQL